MSPAILFDTCAISNYAKSQSRTRTPRLVARIEGLLATQRVHVSAVTLYELERLHIKQALQQNISNTSRMTRNLLAEATIHNMDDASWELAAQLHATAAVRGIVIEDCDLFILSTARAHDMCLLTTDARLGRNVTALDLSESIEVWDLV